MSNYINLDAHAVGYDALIHLAVMNTSSDGTEQDFHAVNVDLTQRLIGLCERQDIQTFVYTSTFHAEHGTTPYAVTKREAECVVVDSVLKRTRIVRLPFVHQGRFRGSLDFFNKLPTPLARLAFQAAACFKPTVDIRNAAQAIELALDPDAGAKTYVSDRQRSNAVYRLVSRTIDLAFSAVILIGLGWLLVLVWLIVKATSPGPGFLAQKRVGLGGQSFTCFKFRTMSTNAPHVATHEISSSHITRVGRWLRKWRIDELPQAINVLLGQMSLVGPRPCLPSQNALISERNRRHVLAVRPGITGLAQVLRVDMTYPQKLAKLDAYYLDHRTLPLDIRIILATVFGSTGFVRAPADMGSSNT